MKRQILAVGTAAMASVCMLSMAAFAEEEMKTQDIQLGTSHLIMTVADDYKEGEMTKEDTSDNQVAYYHSDSSAVDFDVYQWAKATDETLEDAIFEESKEFGQEFGAESINGLAVVYYGAQEEWDDQIYETLTVMAENEGDFVEVVFWLDGDEALEKADAMIQTIRLSALPEEEEDGIIHLGSSSLFLQPQKPYVTDMMTKEDTAEGLVGYYSSGESFVDFDVYQWAKATEETVEEAAAEEAKLFGAEVEEVEINGIKVQCYKAEEEIDGKTYPTRTYLVDDDKMFVEVVIWLDGEDAEAEADAIISTLNR